MSYQPLHVTRPSWATLLRTFTQALLLSCSLTSAHAQSQASCVKDNLGRPVCAKPGGMAVKTLTGVACAPGRCETDNLGYWRCSRELGGGAVKTDIGRVMCVGGCINPSKEYCAPEMKE